MQGPEFAPQTTKTSFLSLAQKFSMPSHSLGIKDLSTHFRTTGPALLQGPSLGLYPYSSCCQQPFPPEVWPFSFPPSFLQSSSQCYFSRRPYLNSTLSPCLNFLQNLNYLRNYTFTYVCLSSLECNLNNIPVDSQFRVNSRHSRLALAPAGCSSLGRCVTKFTKSHSNSRWASSSLLSSSLMKKLKHTTYYQ